jgi:enamine deaminase RidA (YjgF/YER057c/UK114 family)
LLGNFLNDFSRTWLPPDSHWTGGAESTFHDTAPASTLVEVSQFVHKDYLIEINAIAVLPE